ncbi:MAG: acyl-CoA dehydrogenase family protein [Chloroflexi bacterium]|nr:acyl-CoA dehydrogenase family protein [Chloroflexota bacterium]
MNWDDTAEQAAFRASVRAFVAERLPAYYRKRATLVGGESIDHEDWQHDIMLGGPEARQAAQEWATALAERGWSAPHWPSDYGGAGLSPIEQFIYKQELSQAGAPIVGGPGVGMLGPTVMLHGSEDQKRHFLPRTLSGEYTWAQGYSEPGAGSDLASLVTSARRDGDEYVVNGQKIWTSGAHKANWIFLLVRTDPDAPKHRGISFLLAPLDNPGVDVRPILSAGWIHRTNESFYEDVRIPVGNRIGEENRGWYVAMTLLDYERSNIESAVEARKDLDGLIAYLGTTDGARRSRAGELDALRQQLASRYVESEVLLAFSFRIISVQNAGQVPNYEASVSKIFRGTHLLDAQQTGMKIFGLYSQIWDERSPHSPLDARYTQRSVHLLNVTISGGTHEIQRNIIATRGLGLPRG